MKLNMTEQEYQVKVILPSIRRVMAEELQGQDINQKKIARMMGLTEGAISQYLSRKRAIGYEFNLKQISIIKLYVKKLMTTKKPFKVQSLCLNKVTKWEQVNTKKQTPK